MKSKKTNNWSKLKMKQNYKIKQSFNNIKFQKDKNK